MSFHVCRCSVAKDLRRGNSIVEPLGVRREAVERASGRF
jgi:hypothetical protein